MCDVHVCHPVLLGLVPPRAAEELLLGVGRAGAAAVGAGVHGAGGGALPVVAPPLRRRHAGRASKTRKTGKFKSIQIIVIFTLAWPFVGLLPPRSSLVKDIEGGAESESSCSRS